MIVFAWLFSFEYYIWVCKDWLSTMVSSIVDIFLCPSCDISHVALGGVPLLCMSTGCGGICHSPLMSSCMYCTFDVLYIYTASFWYCLSGIPYGNTICPVPTFIYTWIHCNCFDIKRAAATFAQFACTLNGKHEWQLLANHKLIYVSWRVHG